MTGARSANSTAATPRPVVPPELSRGTDHGLRLVPEGRGRHQSGAAVTQPRQGLTQKGRDQRLTIPDAHQHQTVERAGVERQLSCRRSWCRRPSGRAEPVAKAGMTRTSILTRSSHWVANTLIRPHRSSRNSPAVMFAGLRPGRCGSADRSRCVALTSTESSTKITPSSSRANIMKLNGRTTMANSTAAAPSRLRRRRPPGCRSCRRHMDLTAKGSRTPSPRQPHYAASESTTIRMPSRSPGRHARRARDQCRYPSLTTIWR